MYLGTVIGSVVAERKAEGLEGRTFLLVQPVDDAQKAVGPMQVAVDTVKAGPGDLVVLVGSREAALALDPFFVPVDAAIVGIVDDLNVSLAKRPAQLGARVGADVAKADRAKASRT